MEKKSKTKPSTNGEERKEDKSKGSFKERRKECLSNIDKVPTVNIKGKEYSTVAERQHYILVIPLMQ